jgi:hypothetical protein
MDLDELRRPAGAAQLVEVHVDPGCGCCRVWADIVRQSGRFEVTVIESADVWALKDRVGVPAELRSCHTALIGDHAVEGHVPVEDMLRLLDRRPRGVIGLAVPGMPRGSPGMEMPDGSRDAFDVLAFDRAGASTVFASYPASA